ncbi:metal ABC transporter solute-binding protein, Zn/Mn family [Atopococcus tabaci]|uniref:metal ABC transporter solute-binding protein, Zn/Mn family n=1 Tax=Atopococcus tabaci TaxID=269774 RepID=UPI002408F88D|nr:zinc ABC transporter substrate-binding protein [Atopococcus tabaci]
MMKKRAFLLIGMVAVFLAGCQWTATEAGEEDTDALQIVTTTTMITDLVEQIGGEHVQVEGLMGPGVDPHGYQATASDVIDMMEADVVVHNGLHLEAQLGEVFSGLDQQGKDVLVLEESIPEENLLASDDSAEAYDPHIWFSVENWKHSAAYITEKLSAIDPEHAEDYRANNERYQKELDKLEAYIAARIEEVPEESRYLITAHDAFHYFGEAFGFDVIGLQGLNTQTEAGTRDVSNLAQFVADHRIKAVFVESSVPTRTIESLQAAVHQRGWEIAIGGELFSDALGDASQNAETYVKMYRSNIDTIVDALK